MIELALPKPRIDYSAVKEFCRANTKPLLQAMSVKKDKGRYYCPMCQQVPSDHKTPDLTVRAEAICCWRCGWKGDIIRLYMDSRNVGFSKALEDLSGKDFKAAVANYKPTAKVQKKVVYYPTHERAINAVIFATTYRIVNCWKYLEMDGSECMVVYRIENGNKSYRPISYAHGKGWFIGRLDCKSPLYNLPSITNSWEETVFVVEGEKAADALIGIGLIATTSAGGANGLKTTDWEPLTNRKVIIWPDNDKAGHGYAEEVKKILPQAVIWKVPDMGQKEDAYDFVQKYGGASLSMLRKLYKDRT
jgi:DNA primase